MVQEICGCDPLDITWARFKYILLRWSILKKLKDGKGLDHKEIETLQKDCDAERSGSVAELDREREESHTFGGS